MAMPGSSSRAVRNVRVVYNGRVAAAEKARRKKTHQLVDAPTDDGNPASNPRAEPADSRADGDDEAAAAAAAISPALSPRPFARTPSTTAARVGRAAGDLPSGGVTSATARFRLPRPEVGVRNLLEQARYGQLCTLTSAMHGRRSGFPYGAVVELAVDASGAPIISLAPLAVHARNLRADSRSTLVIQMPGWSGLANARATLFGEVTKLPDALKPAAKQLFAEKSGMMPPPPVAADTAAGTPANAAVPSTSTSTSTSGSGSGSGSRSGASWKGRDFFRMNISDIYFVGGFGTEKWIDAEDYRTATPDAVVVRTDVQRTLDELTRELQGAMRDALDVEDAVLVSIDARGVDARVRRASQFGVERLSFEDGEYVETAEDAARALKALLLPPRRQL